MRLIQRNLRLAASDVANHLACRHLTELNRAAAEGRLESPHFEDSGLDALRERGLEHERQYLEALRKEGLEVVEISSEQSDAAKIEATAGEMRRGAEIIAQGALGSGRWFGLADVLRRVDLPSKLGAFSYEPHDTKLARETKGSAVLRLCLYSDLLEQAQGVLPEYLHVVPPGVNFVPQSFRVRDLIAPACKSKLNSNATVPAYA
jgi:predicted RecB family nuclease